MSPRDAFAALGAMALYFGTVGLIVHVIDGTLTRRDTRSAARRATARLGSNWTLTTVTPVEPVLASWLRRHSSLGVAAVIFASTLAYESLAGADCGEERAVVGQSQ